MLPEASRVHQWREGWDCSDHRPPQPTRHKWACSYFLPLLLFPSSRRNWGWKGYCVQNILLGVKTHFKEKGTGLAGHWGEVGKERVSACDIMWPVKLDKHYDVVCWDLSWKCFTYSFFIWRTWSIVTTPARLKFSPYWLILMDSSHSDTDLKGEPSEPLVLGRRMETLQAKESRSIWNYATALTTTEVDSRTL